MKKIQLFSFVLLSWIAFTSAQTTNGVFRMDELRNPKKREIVTIPNVNGFLALKCDFHMHTVFSDGQVWPSLRIQEAWEEGLDAIAITDHIEYHPHSEDVAVTHNRPYELAKDQAAEQNLILIKGSEITRRTPPGHFNAIFIGDASRYIEDNKNEKDKEALSKAEEQDAFIFWNHPGWKVDQIEGSYEWIDFVEELYKKNMLDGIEVFNGFSFYKKALDWCVDKNLTVMGSTDIHNLIGHEYVGHRTMTLVFARERTASSIREALKERRTVAWSGNYLAGKEEQLDNLFHACVEVSPSYYSKADKSGNNITQYYEISNVSDLYFELHLEKGKGTKEVKLYPKSSQIITAPVDQKKLSYEVMNAYIRSDQHLVVDIPLRK